MTRGGELPAFSQLAMRFTAAMRRKRCDDADRQLELARRIVWMQHFRGGPFAEVAAKIGASRKALDLAEAIAVDAKGSLLAADEAFMEVKLCLYMSAFQGEDSGRFGRALKEHMDNKDNVPDGERDATNDNAVAWFRQTQEAIAAFAEKEDQQPGNHPGEGNFPYVH